MNLSINPTYYCNFKCDFCYLTKEQLSDRKKITPEKLDELLSNIEDPIEHIDLYGGEIALLTPEYFYSIKNVIKKYYQGVININTNFSALPDFFYDDDIKISVSYDFSAREKEQFVLNNIMASKKPLFILVLASPKVLEKDVDEMISIFNMCSKIETVEIKPYSTNQSNAHNVTHKDFEEFVKKWIESPIEKKFQFINENHIRNSLDARYNAFSNDHVYITPNGKYAVLEFDKNDNEYFLELDTYKEYKKWAEQEPDKNTSDICKSCVYYGNCLTEHYRYVKDLDNGCNGYKGLLDWYNDKINNVILKYNNLIIKDIDISYPIFNDLKNLKDNNVDGPLDIVNGTEFIQEILEKTLGFKLKILNSWLNKTIYKGYLNTFDWHNEKGAGGNQNVMPGTHALIIWIDGESNQGGQLKVMDDNANISSFEFEKGKVITFPITWFHRVENYTGDTPRISVNITYERLES